MNMSGSTDDLMIGANYWVSIDDLISVYNLISVYDLISVVLMT